MSLSAGWGQSNVVVRCDKNENRLVDPNNGDLSTTNGTARAYAAVGNPIIVRSREKMLEEDLRNNANSNSSNSSGGAGGSTSLVVRSLGLLTGGGGGGKDVSDTYWVPVEGKEAGLLEILHKRGASNKTYVLLQSRPIEELRRNFSTVNGNNIDLSHTAFRLSKTATALQHMDYSLSNNNTNNNNTNNNINEYVIEELDEYGRTIKRTVYLTEEEASNYNSNNNANNRKGKHHRTSSRNNSNNNTISMTTQDFKSTLRASLQSLQQEDYYLVRYRDYSAWAVNNYRSITKTDNYLFGKRYVEQCFAVHVGREPGELIPITETQFIFGAEILQRQLLNQLDYQTSHHHGSNTKNYSQYQTDLDYCCLSQDQFRSLGIVLESRAAGEGGMREVEVEGEEQKKKEEARRKEKENEDLRRRGAAGGGSYYDPFYEPPAWYDWSPAAIRKRVQHQVSYYYHSIGRLTLQAAVLGLCGWYIYSTYLKGFISSNSNNSNNNSHNSGNNNSNRGGRNGHNSNYNNNGGGYVPPSSFLRSVFMGPKDVFDYILAPYADTGSQ